MGRVEKFRRIRIIRKKYIMSFIIFITLLTVGISAADYSINSLMGSKERLRLLGISTENEKVVFYFVNNRIDFNIHYVKNDLERLRKLFEDIFGKKS